MATLQGKAVKNTYRQVLQIGANNVGVSGTLQPVQDGAGINTALSLSTTAATINGTLTITGDLIITGGGIQIQDLIDDTVASLIQNGTGITWAYNDTLRTLTPTITIATADGGVQGDFMQLNTGAGEANAVAKIYWNSTEGTADLGLMGGQVILPLGQKQVARVLNNSGSIFNKSAYQVVKITAAQGQRLAVGLAQANNDANSTDTLGLVAENIANNQEGFITTSGLITGVDTTGDLQLEDWNDGDILYLSPTTPGAITKVKPVAPQHTIIVGFVVYAHKTQGKIYVKVDNGYELDELHNVRITAVANDNILQYNSSLGVWENVAGTTTNIAEGTNLYYTQARFDSAFAAKTTTNLAEGTNLYFTTARGDANFATNFATKTTTNLPEGTNLYFTNSRARLALSVTAGTGISYNDGTGVFSLASIPNTSLTNSSVTINSLALPLGGSVTLTTSNIAEGTNLYWTNARFDSRFGTKTTTDLAEGTNLYYTQARFNTAFDAKTTTDLDEGTNLYYTDARARAAISENAVGLDYSNTSGVLSLTSGYAIPTTVKLGQYDTAYNRSIVSAAVTGTGTKTLSLTQQDANVITATWTDQGITTINGTANQIAATTVGNTTTLAFTNDVTMPNNLVVSGNLTINGTATYVNTQSISAKDPLFEVANDNNTTDAVDIGYYGRYFDSAQTRVEFTGLFRDASDAGKFKFFTGLTVEPTNVVDTTGTGYTVGTLVANVEGNLAGTANAANVLSTARSISATGDAAWTVNFDGSANATGALTLANTGVTATTYGTSTSVPTIAVDGKGRITSASNTAINFPVTTVNSLSGNVVLTTSNVAEGTNQYFTTARVSSYLTGAISTVLTTDLTASRVLVSDGTGKIAASATTTTTELGYLAGVTSAIQTQLNAKAADNAVVHLAGTETITGAKTFNTDVIVNGWLRPNNIYAFTADAGTTYIQQPAGGNIVLRKSDSTVFLTIANSGAATFSGQVAINGASLDINPSSGNSNITLRTANVFEGYIQAITGGGILFGTGASATERMRITSSGSVLLAKDQIFGINTTDGSDNGYLALCAASGDGDNRGGHIYLSGNERAADAGTVVLSAGNVSSGAVIVRTGAGVERMKITSDGKAQFTPGTTGATVVNINSSLTGSQEISYGVGRTLNTQGSAFFGWRHNGGAASSYGFIETYGGSSPLVLQAGGGNLLIGKSTTGVDTNGFRFDSSGVLFTSVSTGENTYYLRDTTNAVYRFYVTSGGTINATNTTISAISDVRLKENITDLKIGLDAIMALRPRQFDWKKESGNDGKNVRGFIAQEFEQIFPDLIDESINPAPEGEEPYKQIRQDLIPILVKAIQEQQAQIEELKALIAAK